MPVRVQPSKKDGKTVYKVVDPKGKVFGTHRSRNKALAQVTAINLSEKRKKRREKR